MSGASFKDADLTGATFHGATGHKTADFTGAIGWAEAALLPLPRAIEGRCSGAPFGVVDYSDCDLRSLVLTNADIGKSDLSGADMTGVLAVQVKIYESTARSLTAINVDFTRADSQRVDFTASQFMRSDLTDADFTEATLEEVDFSQAVLERVKITSARMSSAVLMDVQMKEANGLHLIADGANFLRADLRRAEFPQASFRGASFVRADLTGATFTDADVTGATFQHAAGLDTVQ